MGLLQMLLTLTNLRLMSAIRDSEKNKVTYTFGRYNNSSYDPEIIDLDYIAKYV